jgi:hypothetical protein
MDIRWQLIEYIQSAVMSAKGNVVSFNLKQIKKALGMNSKAEETALKLALGALADLGLLQRVPGKKLRYFLRRGSPLWNALELGCTDLLTILMDRHPRKYKLLRSHSSPKK